MPKIWCFCGEARAGVSERDAFNVDINPESRLCHCCLLLPLCPLFPYSICCHGHPHATRQFTCVTLVCCHYVKPSRSSIKVIVWDCNLWKPKLTGKKTKKTCPYLFCSECLHFVFFLPLRTVTSFVFIRVIHVLSITCMLLCIYAIVAVTDGLWI